MKSCLSILHGLSRQTATDMTLQCTTLTCMLYILLHALYSMINCIGMFVAYQFNHTES